MKNRVFKFSSQWRFKCTGWEMWKSSRSPAKPLTLAMSTALARGAVNPTSPSISQNLPKFDVFLGSVCSLSYIHDNDFIVPFHSFMNFSSWFWCKTGEGRAYILHTSASLAGCQHRSVICYRKVYRFRRTNQRVFKTKTCNVTKHETLNWHESLDRSTVYGSISFSWVVILFVRFLQQRIQLQSLFHLWTVWNLQCHPWTRTFLAQVWRSLRWQRPSIWIPRW